VNGLGCIPPTLRSVVPPPLIFMVEIKTFVTRRANFKAKMQQSQFRLALRPQTPLGVTALPRLQAGFKGILLKAEKGEKRN